MFDICSNCFAHVRTVELTLASFSSSLGDNTAFFPHRCCRRLSHTTPPATTRRPMPRNPSASVSGAIFQSSVFRPVADQLDRGGDRAHRYAAPPRPSPSTRATQCRWIPCARPRPRQLAASLSVSEIRDQASPRAIGRCFDLGAFPTIISSSRAWVARGGQQHHVVAAELGGFERGSWQSWPLLVRRPIGQVWINSILAAEALRLLHCRRSIDCRTRPSAPCACRAGQAARSQFWLSWWSVP